MTRMPYPHLQSRLRRQWQAEGREEGRIEEAAATASKAEEIFAS